MLSIWVKSSGFKRTSSLVNRNIFFSNSFRNKISYDDDNLQGENRPRRQGANGYKKLFRAENQNKRGQKSIRGAQQNETNVEEYVKKINEINKQFLGIKLNTDYFKVYNQKKFEEVCKADKSQSYKINDLPFSVKSKQTKAEEQSEKPSVQSLPNNSANKMLSKLISKVKMTHHLQNLAKNYFTDLIKGQRNSSMQVNFQVYARKVIQTLKANKWSFKLTNADAAPKISVRNVTLLKGVKVNRNDNYTVDSYNLNLDQEDDGIVTYKLFKKQRQEYPESEWFAQKFIVARIQAQVSNCPIVQVSDNAGMQNSSKGVAHSFVFQADLTVPPSLSVLSLSGQEFLNSYRLKPQNIYITNVDNKNVWYNMAYKEEEKKFKLINKLI